MENYRWSDLTRTEFELALERDPAIILPLGSTEQHGPHLPVDTDAAIPLALAEETGAKMENVLVTPPISFGYSPHHGGIPGTITISSETLMRLVKEVIKSIQRSGFNHVIVLNGHGGNRAPVQTAISDVCAETGFSSAFVSYWDLIISEIECARESDFGGVSHAGEMETSLQLYLRNEHLDVEDADFIRDDKDGYVRTDLFGHGQVYYPMHFDEMTETGVSGQPSLASAEKGEQLFNAGVDALIKLVDSYKEW